MSETRGEVPIREESEQLLSETAKNCNSDNDNKQQDEVAELLLRSGGDPNLANADGSTALHLICSKGLVDLAKILFEVSQENNRPVQVDARDKFGNTPLLLVVDDAHRYLRLKEIYKYVESPLKHAYEDYRFMMLWVKFLRVSRNDKTDQIEYRRRKDLVQLLLRQGADSNLANADGLTPLHCICKDYYDDDRRLAQLLFENELNQPCRVDAQDNLGNTPLHLALKYDNIDVAELLLRNGANPNLANEEGLTPLHHICQRSRIFYCIEIKFLSINDELNQQVHIDARDKSGNTPLHLALRQNNRIAVKSLLKRGANLNLTDAEGLTSLHLIYLMGYHGWTKMLLEICDELNQPLEIEARDKLGRTPLQWAVAGLQPEMVDVLLDRGADLSNFVFPTQSHFDECSVLLQTWYGKDKLTLLLQLSFGALGVIEQLEKRGYELDRSNVLTIMTLLYGNNGFFEKSKQERPRVAKICWYDDEEFTSKAKEIMINSTYSLYDLTRIEPKEAKKITLFADYFKFVLSDNLNEFSKPLSEACISVSLYLFEKLSRGFFQEWAMDPFWVLIHYRLPVEICEIILEKLENQDLCNICLAVKLQNS
ncbi:ankyrin-1-like [Trichogramma pretiosum]|uniref:ankyrin-1-like n=1 Tax=Trichogramma pretiosum TaxID=7493 RepID=UPI000C719C79|nr:ankyrin-1-like [Trichogramma pretiosum]